MTRDKAIDLRMGAYSGSDDWRRRMASRDVDDYAALGMLKLDPEDHHPEQVLSDVLSSAGLRGLQQRVVLDGIYAAGLKIIAK